MPRGTRVAFDDRVRGRIEQDVGEAVGDFVLRRADGLWAYQLAVVVDDAAVTPKFVEGVDPKRELPIIKRIAIGSLFNKIVIILPIILLLSQFLPWLLTPLLMIGGKDRTAPGANRAAPEVAARLGDYPVLGRRAAEAIPDAQLVEFPALGHSPQVESPDDFHAALLQHL